MSNLSRSESSLSQNPGLRYIEPYYHPYKTFAKQRWYGRELLEVVSTEFRDRSVEYYRHALEAGVTTLNGKVASPTTILRNGDALQNVVHRHEPPVTAHPIQIIHEDPKGDYIVIDKPGSYPVHPTGRYNKNTCTETLQSPEYGYKKVYTVNRLDRLTSGLMFVALNAKAAAVLQEDFLKGRVKKEYIARVRGEFPEGEMIVDQPLLTIDKQSGLVVVAKEGKEAKTIFNRVFYDKERNESVVACRPQTGRTHQIRVHLQWLGHPIPNDPIYSLASVWSASATFAKGGIDLTPSDWKADPGSTAKRDYSPPRGEAADWDEAKAAVDKRMKEAEARKEGERGRKLMPRETGEDIGSSSPIKLSDEAREIIRRLRRMKDEAEDWARWKDIVLYTNEATKSPAIIKSLATSLVHDSKATLDQLPDKPRSKKSPKSSVREAPSEKPVSPTIEPEKVEEVKESREGEAELFVPPEGFCKHCYIPLAPDPDPDRLFIYLHAIRYKTSFGQFETGVPIWAREGWNGENSWEARAKGQGAAREVKSLEEGRKIAAQESEPIDVQPGGDSP
ncbi:RNA pseudouridylate synthases [Phaffia rhodozyma]|uniref:RNA pseudouridylate synthases n=1 Tax=Phaffia rhodozyma TaxID=264483 RepID=A0A0F7SXC2_PHARH|nr:RNA pseudouridylate synthases [Phaffia rhodozyma]